MVSFLWVFQQIVFEVVYELNQMINKLFVFHY